MPEKTCTLLFLRRDDDILLAMKKRGFGSHRYNGVGGKVDPGETIEQALVRECQEEIVVTPQNYWKVAEHHFTLSSDHQPWQMRIHTYLCDKWLGEPTETDEMAPQWFSIKDIPYKKMWDDDIFWLPHVLAGKKVLGSFTFDNSETMLAQNVKMIEEFSA